MTAGEKKDQRKQLGQQGEMLAVEHLSGLRYRIVQSNWRCRSGEIDIIAYDGEVLVFVEVRTRRLTGTFGTPQESVDGRKQKQVRATAQVYLHQHKLYDSKVRFDLVSVHMDLAGELNRIEHLPHAF
jgi:putative endonuclease